MVSNVFIRADYTKKNGKVPIFLRLQLDKQYKIKIPNVEILPKNWDKKRCRVKKAEPYYMQINNIIESALDKADKIILDYTCNNQTLTFELFKNDFLNKETESDFFGFWQSLIDNYFTIKETKKTYQKHLNKVKECAGTQTLPFSELTLDFIDKFIKFCKEKKNNQDTTIEKTLKNIKTIVKKAIEKGVIEKHPIERLKIEHHNHKRKYFDIEHFKLLLDFWKRNTNVLSEKQNGTIQAFLFCCCTGLRFTDGKNLKYKNIIGDRLFFRENKTTSDRSIPIIESAFQFFEDPKNIVSNLLPVFCLPCNPVANRHLKAFAKQINTENGKTVIPPELSFHYSRHGCGQIVYDLTGDIYLTKEIVGHKDIQTTIKNYVSVSNKREMESRSLVEKAMFS